MTIVHWIACGWMLINPNSSLDPITYYNTSLYWTVTTLTTVGYGDIFPLTERERLAGCFVLVIGVCIFGFIMGEFIEILMNYKGLWKEG